MGVLDPVLNRLMAAAVRQVDPVIKPPDGLVAEVYAQMGDECGLLPPFICQAAAPEVLAASWTASREAWLAGPVGRLEREVIAAGVSRANRCPFCVEAHSMTQRVADHDVAGDEHLGAIAAWAEASSSPEGVPPSPFPPEHIPWMVGTAVSFHYVNRVVNVLLEESGVPGPMRRLGRTADLVADRLVGKPMLRLNPEPGRSLTLLPETPLPGDLEWAATDKYVAGAFARADPAFARAAEKVYADDVRELIAERVSTWDGSAPGVSRAWVDAAVADLPAGQRPQATLGLLSALASYQIDDGTVAAFRRDRPADRDLVVAVAWPAWLAAKKIGSWLAA